MFCEQCGMKLEEGTRFCPGCGCKVGGETIEAMEAVRGSGADMGGQYNGPAVQGNPSGDIPNSRKPKKTMILIGAAAAVMLLVIGTFAVVMAMTFTHVGYSST